MSYIYICIVSYVKRIFLLFKRNSKNLLLYIYDFMQTTLNESILYILIVYRKIIYYVNNKQPTVAPERCLYIL